MPNVTIVIGAQWGDEGKGKWVDILAQEADVVARYQGGNNAGHTLYVDGEKIVLHQIPSGIFKQEAISALAAGVVVNPVQLVSEIDKVQRIIDVTPDRLWLSARAQVITPFHVFLDQEQERTAQSPIGTTKRGIGPTYAAKAARQGLRLDAYIDPTSRDEWLRHMESNDTRFKPFLEREREQWQEFVAAAAKIAPYVCDAEHRVRAHIHRGDRVLIEGAQGALLDIDHGTYPFVTSSSTCAGGALASIGFSPKRVGSIYGVAKAYLTRVGSGPFPTELKDNVGKTIAAAGNEFGATTGRPRRCGWLDGVALRYAYEANGLDGLILNKMDILSTIEEIKICVAYEHPKLGRLESFPTSHHVLADCRPVYRSFPGWCTDLPERGSFRDLPRKALDYIEGVEEAVGGHVAMVGTGVNRSNAIYR